VAESRNRKRKEKRAAPGGANTEHGANHSRLHRRQRGEAKQIRNSLNPNVTTENSRIEVAEVTQDKQPNRILRNGMVHLAPEELLAVLKTARSRSDRDWAMILLVYRHGLRLRRPAT